MSKLGSLTITQRGCQLSRMSASLTPGHFLTLSRQACKISGIKENITSLFCLSLFLKVKTDTQFDRRRRKDTAKNCKNIKISFFFFMFWFHAKQFSKVDSPVHNALLTPFLFPTFLFWISGKNGHNSTYLLTLPSHNFEISNLIGWH